MFCIWGPERSCIPERSTGVMNSAPLELPQFGILRVLRRSNPECCQSTPGSWNIWNESFLEMVHGACWSASDHSFGMECSNRAFCSIAMHYNPDVTANTLLLKFLVVTSYASCRLLDGECHKYKNLSVFIQAYPYSCSYFNCYANLMRRQMSE